MDSEQDDIVPILEKYSIELKQLISACISFKPIHRSDANDLLKMVLTKIQDNAKYKTAFLDFQLLQAAGKGNLNQLLDLFENGAQIEAVASTDGIGVFHQAAKLGNEALIPFLLAKRVEISCSAYNGETLLHCAALARLYSMVHIFLDEGAYVNTLDERGWTAVHNAAANNHSEVISTLIEEESILKNIDYPTIDKTRLTPLHITVCNICKSTLQCLIDEGANIEAAMAIGSIALYSATESGVMPWPVLQLTGHL